MSENSQHIGYKKCRDGRIVVLEILGNHNENREDIADKRFAKMRCSRARVIGIYDMLDPEIEYEEAFGIYDKTFKYTVGEVVEPINKFKKNRNIVCASGIHYFLTKEPAYYWQYVPKNGLHERWHSNGQMAKRCTYENGELDGLYETWHSNGQMSERCTYVNGEPDGLFESWLDNGQMWELCMYENGMREDLYEE